MTAAEISRLPDEAFVEPGDTTLVKSTRPATCAVCQQVVTGSIELPEGDHVCSPCALVALRWMIVDRAACAGGGSGAFGGRGGRT